MKPSKGSVLVLVALFLLLNSRMEVFAKKGVLIPHISLKPPLLDQVSYTTTYACEGKTLNIFCDDGVIHMIRANYGRFSISICNEHGNLEWRVNCMSYHSFLIMRERCHLRPNCSVNVSSTTFQDPCPGTLKYLEVQYHCGSDAPLPTTPISSMPPLLKVLPTVNTTFSLHESKTQAVPSVYTTVSTQVPAVPTHSSIIRHPPTSVIHLLPNVSNFSNKTSILISNNSYQEVQYKVPMLTSTFKPSAFDTTIIYSKDYYCPSTSARGIEWVWTKAGETATVKCPDGAIGVAKWHCRSNPVKWDTEFPNLKQCRSLWLENIKERMESGEAITSVTTELAQMSSDKALFSIDLREIADLIQQVLYKGVSGMENFLDTWHKYHVLRELLQSLVHILSNLLDAKQKEAWGDLLSSEKRFVISSLLEALEESALLLAETSNHDASLSMIKNNVFLSLKVLKVKSSTNIQFPIFEEIGSEIKDNIWYTMQDSLQIPAQALQEYSRNGFVKIVFAAFNNVEDYLKPGSVILPHLRDYPAENITRIANSRVISASLEGTGHPRLFQPVLITLKHLREENVTNPVCVFWDFHSREWSARGCWVESSNKTYTVCACNHLTNFAVIMELKSTVVPLLEIEVLHMITTIGCIIAIICILITAVVILILRNVTGDAISIHRNLFLCLLISEIVFVGGINQTQNHTLCAVVAGTLQYFFLAAFSWLFFECYHQYITIIETCDTSKNRARWYYAVAYIIPAVTVGVAATIDPTSYGTQKYCWLKTDNYFVFSFVGPAVGILFGGMIFLCISMGILCHQSSITTAIKGKEEAKLTMINFSFRRSSVLTLLVSLTWTSGLLYLHKESVFLAYSFSILNGIQGIFAFVCYCINNKEVKQEFLKLLSNQTLLSSCQNSKQKDQEPQITAQIAPTGTTPGEHIQQQFWNLMKDKNLISSPKCITPGPLSTTAASSPEGDTEIVANGSLQDNKNWDVIENSRWQPYAYSSGDEGMRDDSSSATLPVEYQTSGQQPYHPQYRHLSVDSEANAQFMDHIYETIDNDSMAVDYQHQLFVSHQQFPPAENYYGDHSDLSQHSSSSYGYDQRPLLIAGAEAKQPNSPQSYCISRDYSGSSSPSNKQKDTDIVYNNQSKLYRTCEEVNPEKTFSAAQQDYDGIPNESASGNQTLCAKDTDADSWGPSLPDLLRCPVDSAVVLAVLDGEKVVSRLQQDDTQCPAKYKLSTYC